MRYLATIFRSKQMSPIQTNRGSPGGGPQSLEPLSYGVKTTIKRLVVVWHGSPRHLATLSTIRFSCSPMLSQIYF